MTYRTSPIKPPRVRSTKAAVASLRASLLAVVAESHPMSVRQVFYQSTVRDLVPKTENGYRQVQHILAEMRRVGGEMPRGWIADSTRWQRKPRTFDGPHNALNIFANAYRKDAWAKADCRVEVWLEKDALVGVLWPIISMYDVPLMVTRGYASISFLSDAAADISESEKPTYIYHLGDFDPSGQDAARVVEESLRTYAPDSEIHFERIAVTEWQIHNLDLPSRPTKKTDTRAKKHGEISVELDAIPPHALRALVKDNIEKHLSERALIVNQVAEESERDWLKALANMQPRGIEGSAP